MRKTRSAGGVTVVLLIIAALIVLVIVAGTLWAFAGRHVNIRARQGLSLFSSSVKDPAAADVPGEDASGSTAVYTGLGTLRAPTKDDRPITVVLTVYFPYPARDSAFEEELTGKNRAIRRVILEWFASRTLEEITSAGEKQVKDRLLEEINRLFVLGRIDTLYFGDYLVLE